MASDIELTWVRTFPFSQKRAISSTSTLESFLSSSGNLRFFPVPTPGLEVCHMAVPPFHPFNFLADRSYCQIF